MSRILAIDFGLKRVGFAISDPLKIIASPFKNINFTSLKNLIDEIKETIKTKNIAEIIIGIPSNANETQGELCRYINELFYKLQKVFKNIKITLWDESYTSREAEAVLHKAGLKRKNMKKKLDKIAASIMLEDYLKTLNNVIVLI